MIIKSTLNVTAPTKVCGVKGSTSSANFAKSADTSTTYDHLNRVLLSTPSTPIENTSNTDISQEGRKERAEPCLDGPPQVKYTNGNGYTYKTQSCPLTPTYKKIHCKKIECTFLERKACLDRAKKIRFIQGVSIA